METRRAIASVATAFTLVLTGCGSEDVDTDAVVEDAGEDARAQAEEALADLRAEAEEALDEMPTPEAPDVKQELLDRCRDALESMRDADMQTADSVQQICDRIEGADLSDMDVWNEIQQEIEDLEMS